MSQSLEDRFRILVCIDGSDESYRGLRYAAKLYDPSDTDIVLVYVRPVDQGLRSGGLQVRVVRENMLNWGLELPGIKYLKKGRDILIEMGLMEDGWTEKVVHLDAYNDPLGDNKIEYHGSDNRMVVLKLKVAPNITTGILDQFELAPYDLIILGASERWRTRAIKTFWDPAVAEEIAQTIPCSVIVSRELEAGHGHLVCVDDSDNSLNMVRENGWMAARCDCPVTMITVVENEEKRAEGQKLLDKAQQISQSMGARVVETIVEVGDPSERIVETGPDFSLIVVADTEKSALQRLISGSVSQKILKNAYNSVLVLR